MGNQSIFRSVQGVFLTLTLVLALFACKVDGESAQDVQVSATPAADVTTVRKSEDPQKSVVFELTSRENGLWKVYRSSAGLSTYTKAEAAFSAPGVLLTGAALTLSASGDDLDNGDYYISVTESGKTESRRLKLTVLNKDEIAVSATPATEEASLLLTETTGTAVFLLTSSVDGVWKVYRQAIGGSPAEDVEVSYDKASKKLTLTSLSGSLEAGIYYVTVTEVEKQESSRLALSLVLAGQTATPAAENPVAYKDTGIDQDVVFVLTAASEGVWKVYAGETGDVLLTTVTAVYNKPYLTLSAQEEDLAPGVYYVSVLGAGDAVESFRLALTVEPCPVNYGPLYATIAAIRAYLATIDSAHGVFGLELPRSEAWVNKLMIEKALAAAEAKIGRLDNDEQALAEAGALNAAVEANRGEAGFAYTFKSVPAGKFQRDVTTANVITISHSYMAGTFEVTQDLYYAVTGTNPSANTVNPEEQVADGWKTLPVENMGSFKILFFLNKLSVLMGKTPVYSLPTHTAQDFADYDISGGITWSSDTSWTSDGARSLFKQTICDWNADGYRLPTEMEWMWAAMGADNVAGDIEGGVNTKGYLKAFAGGPSDGTDTALNDYAWTYLNSDPAGGTAYTSHQVGQKAANELALHDMSGNVAEYCWDYESSGTNGAYRWSAPATDPKGGDVNDRRISRGGDWKNVDGTGDRWKLASRVGSFIQSPYGDVGFRIFANTPGSEPASVKVTFGGLPGEETLIADTQDVSKSWGSDESLTLTVSASGGTSFVWFLDGNAITGQTAATLTLKARDAGIGSHTITVVVGKGGKLYSSPVIKFTVTD